MAPLNWYMTVKILHDAPGNNPDLRMGQNDPFTKKLNSFVGWYDTLKIKVSLYK